jgi:lysozyme
METSVNGLLLIKQAEGFRKSTYKDVAGYPTIGYGHKLLPGEFYPSGITQDQADLLLRGDVKESEAEVSKHNLDLTQNQFDALVDFTYNLGPARLDQLLSHGLDQVATQILRWDHVGGMEVTGLKIRRLAECKLWCS